MLSAALAAIPFIKNHAEFDRKSRRRWILLRRRHGQFHGHGSADLNAGVAYYGAQPPAEQVKSINAPLLLHYAGLDQRINAGIPAYEAALKAAGKRFTIHVYPDVNHAFNNDTGNRYDKPAADLAWSRSIAFFKEQLGAPART